MEEDKSEKRVLPGDEAFTLLFEKLSEEAKTQTAQIMLKMMLCSLADLPGIVLLYDGTYMHIHGISINTTEAKEMIIELAEAFKASKAPEGAMH